MDNGKELRLEIQRLQQLAQQKSSQLRILERNCKHNFSKPVYDPEKVQEFVFTHYEWQGVDCWPQGHYVPKDKPRWSRTCELCDMKEYTYKQKNVSQPQFEPDFS